MIAAVRAATIAGLLTIAIPGLPAAISAQPAPLPIARPAVSGKPASRAAREARFLLTVNRTNSANLVTGDLTYYAGTHVDYACDVDTVVRPGVILGQCGSEAEPTDLFVRLPTAGLHVGDHLRVLGIMEQPVSWADVTGHTVYFAFVRALFVDRLPRL